MSELRPLRVCLVSLDFWPHRSSGLTIYAEDLARGLRERGHIITVVAAARPHTSVYSFEDDVEVWRVPIGPSDWIGYSRCAARLVTLMQAARPFDVVHFLDVHFAYGYRRPFVASLWQSFRQRLRANGGWPYASSPANFALRLGYYNLARLWMEHVSVRRAAHLLAACASTANEFMRHHGLSSTRISRAVQGTDLHALRPVPTAALRQRLGVEGRRVVLFVGFATARKGLEYLAGALRLLPPDVTWVVVGRWEANYRERVLAALGEQRWRLVEAGAIADDERAAYYSLADVYVSPSLLEGLGLTPIEAQACGTPAIVAGGSSGGEEVGDCGLIVPPRDPAALAHAIALLLGNEALRAEMGRRARERVLRLFTYQHMAEQTEAAYRLFLAQTPPLPTP